MLVMMLSDQTLEIVRNSLRNQKGMVQKRGASCFGNTSQGVGIRYVAMLQSLLKQRLGEHDETDLAREIELFEGDISKYEQQSSDLISDAIKHGIVCGGIAHQGLKQQDDLSIRLATYQALRDEIINYGRARRTWTDPNACKSVQCMSTFFWNGKRPTVRQRQRWQARQRQVQEWRQGQGER